MAHRRRATANNVVNSACDTASTDEGYTRQHSLPSVKPFLAPQPSTRNASLRDQSMLKEPNSTHTAVQTDGALHAVPAHVLCKCACAMTAGDAAATVTCGRQAHAGSLRLRCPLADKEFFANVCVAGDRHTRACGLDLPLVACIHRVRCVVHGQARMSARGYALMHLHLLLPFVPEPTCGKTRSPAHASISQLPRLAWTRASLSVPTRLRQPSSRCVSGSLSSAAQHMSCLSLRL